VYISASANRDTGASFNIISEYVIAPCKVLKSPLNFTSPHLCFSFPVGEAEIEKQFFEAALL
jgi:hypothetical protein